MTTLETLKAARKKIEKPEHWAQGEYFFDSKGESLPDDLRSYAFACCAVGAISIVSGKDPYQVETEDACLELRSVISDSNVVYFNDAHTHSEVIAAFDAAIAQLEAK